MNQLSLPQTAQYDPEDAKQLVRSAIRAHRKERTETARITAGEHIAEHVLTFVAGAHCVACYVSVNHEPPTRELCTQIADTGIQLLLPKLGPSLTRSWGYFRGDADLETMAPGRPPEPSGPAFDNSILADIDAMIIPALAVNAQGERLGQGGGWYDRALKEIGEQTKVAAIVYEEEFVDDALPQDEMDVRIPFVITPSGIFSTAAA
ncbi:MAG: 5-formyltetrahydrofolate cyclo-ligase [Actinomycetaceae bacterium]|nr:5-formyltetrahydrofolate cyclo-ligase [Arcanobacterium sp.]MDD7687230.1 5-formyltetrahydrofolate cyclo-ligase [Actinomycetaceae bacterium]MDY5273472.1 5-formyltetrahydrofolate cyclo-ligase [Arcanobacterium sp.]